VRVGAAQETLDALVAEGGEPFDIAFVDADKAGYPAYYESCLQLLRPGGLIVIDNVLRGGAVLDPSTTAEGRSDGDEGTRAVAELNDLIRDDERVEVAMLGIADGITLALKR
jgi:O-methyltransferase